MRRVIRGRIRRRKEQVEVGKQVQAEVEAIHLVFLRCRQEELVRQLHPRKQGHILI
jgi:hypothetical protein